MKEKLLLTNVKNSKNSAYYEKVIKKLKGRCQARDEVFEYDVKQTREKFKRCIGICKDAAMKIKTASGITQFQEDKEHGSWFNKLFNVMESTASCQPEQSIEPPNSQNYGSSSDSEERGTNSNSSTRKQEKNKKGNYFYLSMKLQKTRQRKEKKI